MGKFKNRSEAGELLASHLETTFSRENLIVIGLPRGGVVVAEAIANRLKVELNILIVRKLRAPSNPELAIGAIASGDFIYFKQEIVDSLGISEMDLNKIKDYELKELKLKEIKYQVKSNSLDFVGKRILLVDDGIATGATIEVAIRALRAGQVESICIAVPVASISIVEKLRREAEQIFTLQMPAFLGAVSEFYEDFSPVSDMEVIQILRRARKEKSFVF